MRQGCQAVSLIPDAERYAVDRASGTVHRAYERHAAGLPRTTRRGVDAYTDMPVVCAECWPPATPDEAPGYWCIPCARRHLEGSAIHDRHLVTS